MQRLKFCLPALCMLALVPGSVRAGGKLPPDLAFVPPDCLGFVHVRLQDVWKTEHVKEWRETVKSAGNEALAAFDQRFFPRPSSVERVTLMFNMRQEGFGDPEPIIIIATSKTIDRAAFMKQTVPNAKEHTMKNGKKVLVDDKKRMEIYFVDDKTLAVGPPSTVRQLVLAGRAPKGPLTEALELASQGSKPIVGALNRDAIPIPAQMIRMLPEEIQPLTKFKVAMASIDFEQEGHVDLRLAFGGAADATAAEAAAREGIGMGRALLEKGRAEMEREVFGDGKPGSLDDLPKAAVSLMILGGINQADAYLAQLPVKKAGNALALSIKMPEGSQALISSYAALAGFAYFTGRSSSGSVPARPVVKEEMPKKAEEPKKTMYVDLDPPALTTNILLIKDGAAEVKIPFRRGTVDPDKIKVTPEGKGVTADGKGQLVYIHVKDAKPGEFMITVGAMGDKKGATIKVILKGPVKSSSFLNNGDNQRFFVFRPEGPILSAQAGGLGTQGTTLVGPERAVRGPFGEMTLLFGGNRTALSGPVNAHFAFPGLRPGLTESALLAEEKSFTALPSGAKSVAWRCGIRELLINDRR
jgi:hypothetical protein